MKTAFEKHNIARRLVDYFFWYPFIFLLRGKPGVTFFIKTSKQTNRIRKYARTFKSLEVMYSYKGFDVSEGFWNGVWAAFWDTFVTNGKALRNRLRLMKALFQELILSHSSKKEIKVLSLASGSARGVVETLAQLKALKSSIHVILADQSKVALKFSKELANEFNVTEKFTWINHDILDMKNIVPENSQDIIEIVGFLDYLDQATAVAFLKDVHSVLSKGGSVMISNICNNPERRFLTEIVNWPLIYRDEKSLHAVLTDSGFKEANIKIIFEPFRIHVLATAKKE
jgi:2-polyprenyl-3-methyl-5-hydroxy-6-metoxy-1,4-benzoquinol methylase